MQMSRQQENNKPDQRPVCYGIIPARWQSSRFPGKPLTPILGKPMFVHVYERAAACPDLAAVYLATDDQRIVDAAKAHDVPVLLTPVDCKSGSDRVCRAAESLGLPESAVVINIQGDEPALDTGLLSLLLQPFFADAATAVTTLAHVMPADQIANPDRVKVVMDIWGNALYFSRSPLPYVRDGDSQQVEFLGHIGLYAFRFAVLRQFTRLEQTPLEQLEQLEQLRLLENKIPIRVLRADYAGHGVDRPGDVAVLEELLRRQR